MDNNGNIYEAATEEELKKMEKSLGRMFTRIPGDLIEEMRDTPQDERVDTLQKALERRMTKGQNGG